MRRLLAVIAAAILVLVPGTTSANVSIDAGTNAYRNSQGLSSLSTSGLLTGIAQQRAVQVATREASEGWGTWLHEYGWWPSNCSGIGENLAFMTGPVDTSWAVNSWIGSPPHRANMLGNFDSIGSATYTRSDGTTFYVEVFGKCGSAPAPAPAPAPATVKAPAAPQTGSKAPAPQSASQETSVTVMPDTSMAP